MDKKKRILYNDKQIKFLLGCLEINIICINYEPPVPHRYFTTHSHSTYELHYIPQGRGILRVNQQEYEILPGTFFLTGPGVFHEQISDGIDPMIEYCMNFQYIKKSKAVLDGEYYNKSEIDRIEATLSSTNFWFGKDEYATFDIFERMYYEIENEILGYLSIIQNLAAQIIIHATRSFAACKTAQYTISKKSSYDNRQKIIDDYFRKYDTKLRPSLLAKQLGVSIRQLNRIMQECYSMSFKQMLIHTRLEIAKDLIQDTNLSLKEIAQNTGFSSYSHFYKAFMRKYKTTPSRERTSGDG